MMRWMYVNPFFWLFLAVDYLGDWFLDPLMEAIDEFKEKH
ncbi:hypothetical protein LCGC14_1244250 [marine sediment metagenome]|uniref:Uncharacterized protein n=1 Tax=marine sediment metagenome TaxID=412755 RepID=A0A0F9LS30_9ZZZZ